MPVTYPRQTFGRYGLGLGLTYQLIHDRFGFDLGERYHRDLDYRIQTTMEIDRAAFEAYGKIGLGYEKPFPRVSIEPFGHRFMPAMYGCECGYAQDAEPSEPPTRFVKGRRRGPPDLGPRNASRAANRCGSSSPKSSN